MGRGGDVGWLKEEAGVMGNGFHPRIYYKPEGVGKEGIWNGQIDPVHRGPVRLQLTHGFGLCTLLFPCRARVLLFQRRRLHAKHSMDVFWNPIPLMRNGNIAERGYLVPTHITNGNGNGMAGKSTWGLGQAPLANVLRTPRSHCEHSWNICVFFFLLFFIILRRFHLETKRNIFEKSPGICHFWRDR